MGGGQPSWAAATNAGDAMTSDLGLNKESETGVPNQNPAPADESPSAGMPQTRTLWIW